MISSLRIVPNYDNLSRTTSFSSYKNKSIFILFLTKKKQLKCSIYTFYPSIKFYEIYKYLTKYQIIHEPKKN